MKILGIISIVFMTLSTLAFGLESEGNIVVNMHNFRNDDGKVHVSLFASKEGFPEKSEKASNTISSKIKDQKSTVTFKNIPFGVYAISIIHDENSNFQMDYSWLHIPKEGYGASNNVTANLGPPKFNDAQFELNSGDISVNIKIQY